MKIRAWTSSPPSLGYIWNVQDAFRLRQQHRIVGSLVGCPSRAPRQASFSGLPLILMPEEVQVLLDEGAIDLLDGAVLEQPAGAEAIAAFEKFLDLSHRQQSDAFREERTSEVLAMAEKIAEGKKRKLLKEKREKISRSKEDVIDICEEVGLSGDELREVDTEKVVRDELQKIKGVSPQNCLVQTFHEHPLLPSSPSMPPAAKWSFPETRRQRLRLETFRNLRKREFYLTSGDKFGADFLAYPGDPVLFHAKFVVVCFDGGWEELQRLSEEELVAKCRLGTSVKKRVLVAHFEGGEEDSVKFVHLKWTAAND